MNLTNISYFRQHHNTENPLLVSCMYLSEAERAGYFIFAAGFGSVGFLENFVLCLSLSFTNGFIDAPVNIFVLSLACADLLICGVSTPFSIYNCYHRMFIFNEAISKSFIVAVTGSIFLLTLNRFISTVRPLKYVDIMTFKRTVTLVGIIWSIAVVVLLMAVVGITWNVQCIQQTSRYFMAFYITSSVVMCVYMYVLSRKHRKEIARQVYAVTGQVLSMSDEFRSLRSLLMISGSFAACLLPVTVASFFVDKFTDPVRYFRAVSFTAPLCILNAVIDPIIYYYRSKGFRLSLKMLVRRFKSNGCCEFR